MKTIFFCLALLIASPPAVAEVDLKAKDKFFFESDPKALATSLQVIFRTGSMADPKGKEGLSMLAFRSLLRGTKSRDKTAFFAELERLGAAIDIDVGPSRTVVALDSVSENLEAAIGLLAETILQPALKDSEIDSVREEELSALNQELSSNRKILRRVFRQAIFRETPLAFPPDGTIEGMKTLDAPTVRAFLAERLKAGNAIFAASSNVPEQKVRGWLENAFKALPEGTAPAHPAVNLKPIKGRTVFVVDRKGSSTTEVAIGHYGITADRKDREILETGLHGFGSDSNSLLNRELREKKGWTYGAYGGFDLFERPRRYGGGFMIWAFPQAEHTEALVLKALKLYEGYVKNGLPAKDLDFSRKASTNSYPFKFSTSRVRLSNRLFLFLEGAPVRSVPEYRKIVNGVTQKSLKQAIRKAHDANNLAIVLVGDPSRTEGLLKSIPNIKNVVKVTNPMQAF